MLNKNNGRCLNDDDGDGDKKNCNYLNARPLASQMYAHTGNVTRFILQAYHGKV